MATIGVIAWGISGGRFGVPGGDVVNYLAAGRRLIDGATVYAGAWNTPGTVYYAPPIVVAFGAFTFVPPGLVRIALCLLDLAGLRYIAGSWRAAGLWGLVPLIRAPIAAILLATRRNGARMLAACLLTPGFYIVTAYATLILAGRLVHDYAAARGTPADAQGLAGR